MSDRNRTHSFLRTTQPVTTPASEVAPVVAGPCIEMRPDSYMFDFELLDGERLALPYTSCRRVRINPSKCVIATFVDEEVVIEGRNLRPVYDALIGRLACTLRAVRELSRPTDGSVVIRKISVLELQ